MLKIPTAGKKAEEEACSLIISEQAAWYNGFRRKTGWFFTR